jgi:hypothetical protein
LSARAAPAARCSGETAMRPRCPRVATPRAPAPSPAARLTSHARAAAAQTSPRTSS